MEKIIDRKMVQTILKVCAIFYMVDFLIIL